MNTMELNIILLDIPWSQCLVDPAMYLTAAGIEAGYRTRLKKVAPQDYRPSDGLDVVLGAHAALDLRTGERTILYETEQTKGPRPPVRMEWHYAEARGDMAVPLGFVPALQRPLPRQEKDIDVLFFGSQNARRKAVLAECERIGLKVVNAFGVFGSRLDDLIARSRVVLNLHFYQESMFEYCRVIPLMHKRALVVSEPSRAGEGANLVLQCPAANIPEMVRDIIDHRREDELHFSQAYRLTRSPRLATTLENTIKHSERLMS